MGEKINVTHGNGVVTEIPAIDIMGTSFVQKEQDRDSFYFIVFKQGGQQAWKISDFSTRENAEVQRDHIDDELSRIISR